MPEVRFVADKMLGRLARWLRILGCDVVYGSNFSGKGLIREARQSGRVILTRDRRLADTPNLPPHLLVEDDHFRAQLRQVVDAFGIDPWKGLFGRCVDCNERVTPVARESVAGEVPEYVYATQEEFRRCGRCGHLFWSATHVERVRAELHGMGFVPPAETGALP